MVDLTDARSAGVVRLARTFCFAILIAFLACPAALAESLPEGLTAAPGECLTWPAEPPEGASSVERSLVAIDQQAVASCDRQVSDQAHLLAALATQTAAIEALALQLQAPLPVSVSGEPSVKVANLSEQPTGGTVELSSAARSDIDGDAAALHDDLWFIVGALIAVVVALVFYLEIRPPR